MGYAFQGTDWFALGLTIVDSLDTMLLLGLGSHALYARGRAWVRDELGTRIAGEGAKHDVNLFETTIRVLGGLLSAHMLAADANLGLYPGYDGALLERAPDLGARLLPAFRTSTGLPLHRVNLRRGRPAGRLLRGHQPVAGGLERQIRIACIRTAERTPPEFS